MRLICIEEHAVDPAIMRAAQPTLYREAPYMRWLSSPKATSHPRDRNRPSVVEMSEAMRLGADLGADRIRTMDEYGIDLQIVSYTSPAQLAPDEQAVALTRAANDRLAQAIAADPQRLQGFAVLPWQAPQVAADELDRAVTEPARSSDRPPRGPRELRKRRRMSMPHGWPEALRSWALAAERTARAAATRDRRRAGGITQVTAMLLDSPCGPVLREWAGGAVGCSGWRGWGRCRP